jgi:hypothetical protein
MHTGLRWENLKQRDHSETLHIDGRVVMKWNLKGKDSMVWTRFMWLRMDTTGRLL